MKCIRDLEPNDVFFYFDEICRIPHGSKNTDQISDYCVRFASEHGLTCRQEPCGNVIIWKDATPGYEDAPVVMLQGHLDMVAVKTEDCAIDLDTEGLCPAVTQDGEWVYAEGTSLGGDDGIAVAYILAILADESLHHPALEAVFTVSEEIGLEGATALDTSDLKSTILMNMDSEEEGVFLTGCAGGGMFHSILPAPRKRMTGIIYEWKISGLAGGHSGQEIHLGRANANDLFGRFLAETAGKARFRIGEFSGGEKDNAIPVSCEALLLTDEKGTAGLEQAFSEFAATVKSEYAALEPDMEITLTKTEREEAFVMTSEGDLALRIALEIMPTGVLRMDPEIPGAVQTSLNLGVLRSGAESYLTYAVRSSCATQKEWLFTRMRDITALAGGRSTIDGIYPAWEYQPDSRIRQVMAETYRELTGNEAEITGTHAGVECGIICEKMPGIDAISYGPTMRDIHTAKEMLNIASTKSTYELTKRVLEKLK